MLQTLYQKVNVLMQILFVMGFRPDDAVPVHVDKNFLSGLAERAQSSSRMSMHPPSRITRAHVPPSELGRHLMTF